MIKQKPILLLLLIFFSLTLVIKVGTVDAQLSSNYDHDGDFDETRTLNETYWSIGCGGIRYLSSMDVSITSSVRVDILLYEGIQFQNFLDNNSYGYTNYGSNIDATEHSYSIEFDHPSDLEVYTIVVDNSNRISGGAIYQDNATVRVNLTSEMVEFEDGSSEGENPESIAGYDSLLMIGVIALIIITISYKNKKFSFQN